MTYKVTLVNYINTYPFIESLLGEESIFELDRRIPKACGEAFISGEADFALVPVAFLPKLKRPFNIIKDYGIACDGEVRSVKLLSTKPMTDIGEIWLDPHSTTSVELIKVLVDKYWHKEMIYSELDLNNTTLPDSVLMIGDKVFEHENKYTFHYDLGSIWKELTSYPFVFAVWICKSDIPENTIQHFTDLMNNGINKLQEIISNYKPLHKEIDIESYLGKNIQYKLDENYLKGLSLFFEYSSLRKPNYEFI